MSGGAPILNDVMAWRVSDSALLPSPFDDQKMPYRGPDLYGFKNIKGAAIIKPMEICSFWVDCRPLCSTSADLKYYSKMLLKLSIYVAVLSLSVSFATGFRSIRKYVRNGTFRLSGSLQQTKNIFKLLSYVYKPWRSYSSWRSVGGTFARLPPALRTRPTPKLRKHFQWL